MCAKSWSEIVNEYGEAAECLSDEIRINREKLNSMPRKELGRDAYRIKRRLNILYEERRDVNYAVNLMNKYSKNDD